MANHELGLAINFAIDGNSAFFMLEGWGIPEPGHTWSVGQQSRLFLPVPNSALSYTLVLRALPWIAPPIIEYQTVMFGADDRLVATMALGKDTALAIQLPPPRAEGGRGYVLSIAHLDSERSSAIDTYRDGRSMGLMMRTLRLVARRDREAVEYAVLPPLPGTLEDGSMLRAAEAVCGCAIATVMQCFESLGGWCGLPDLQKSFGADHVGLLRYAGLTVPDLTEGIFRRFEGLGDAAFISVFNQDNVAGQWDTHDSLYRIWWHTTRSSHDPGASAVRAFESRRLPFLARKFAETMAVADKIMVLPVAVTRPEADAVFAALDIWGPNTLLFVSQDGSAPPGTVELVSPGQMRAHLDFTPCLNRGTSDAWFSVLVNAYRLTRSANLVPDINLTVPSVSARPARAR